MIKNKGGGKRSGKGGGKGKGKRKSTLIGRTIRSDSTRVVWIGGLKERESRDPELNKQLQAFINKKCEGCKFVNIRNRGTATAIFGSEAEAQSAISELNGSKFQGQVLEFDVWEKKEKD